MPGVSVRVLPRWIQHVAQQSAAICQGDQGLSGAAWGVHGVQEEVHPDEVGQPTAGVARGQPRPVVGKGCVTY